MDYFASDEDIAWADETIDMKPEQLDTYVLRDFKKKALLRGRLTQEEVDLPVCDLLKKLKLFRNGKPTRAAALMFTNNAEKISPVAYIRIC